MKTFFEKIKQTLVPRIFRQWFKEIKRSINFIIGTGPYDLASFEYISSLAHNEENPYGLDYPESVTGIVYQESTKSVEYQNPPVSLTQKIVSRTVANRSRFLATGIFPEPPRIIYSLFRGGVICPQADFLIIYDVASRLAVKEVTHNWYESSRNQTVFLSSQTIDTTYLEGISLSLATLGGDSFYHFFHQSLPKIFLSQHLLKSVDHFLVNGNEERWRKKWLERSGIPLEKVIYINHRPLTHYQCEQLLFTSSVVADAQPTKWSISALRSLLDAHPSGQGNRWIWASRADINPAGVNRRVFAWEEELLQRFPKFEKVCFSSLSPEEVISVCRSCKVFAGPHGAAFSNLLFCNPDTLVVEFSPTTNLPPYFIRLAEVSGLNHVSVVADFEDLPENFEKIVVALAEILEDV
ncbi:hypothetical protein Cal7507_5313 [Calothrix sp. PCC 7507]|nr:hypothetical protein Cal7507_5313 [Calothrix sp. PCC 7507]